MATEINILNSPTEVNCGQQFTITVNGTIDIVGGYSVCIEKVNTLNTNFFFKRGDIKFINRVCIPGTCTKSGQNFDIDFNNISLNSENGMGGGLDFKATITDSAENITSNSTETNQTIILNCP